MELQDLKKLAEQGFFTDITAYEYYANNEEELQSLTIAQLAELGFINQVDKASTPDPEPEEMVTITFNTTPPEATIEIDGEPLEGKTTQVKKGETITYTAKAAGYKDKTDSVLADSEKTVEVTLEAEEEPIEQVTLTFNITPAEAELTVNSEPCPEKSITVDKGTSVTYTATAEGYDDKTDTVQADSTKEVQVTMTKKQYDFTVNATPDDATVTINNEQVKTKKVEHGSSVTWKVEKENYTPQEGTEESVTQNTTKNITLELVNHTFTINATPEGATVTINDEQKKTLTAPHGTEVRWSVTMEGYTEQSGTETLNDDITKDIELVAAGPAMAAAEPTTLKSKSKSK